MTNVVIASAARTAVGSFGGAFANTPAHDLGAAVLEAVVARAGIDKSEVSETILGQVLTAAQGQNPARQAHINAGLPKESAAWSINQVCGATAVALAPASNWGCVTVAAGGQETDPPHAANLRAGHKMGVAIYRHHDPRWSVGCFQRLPHGPDCRKRRAMADFARHAGRICCRVAPGRSRAKSVIADEIAAFVVKHRKGDITVDQDEYIRHGATIEAMQKLRPAFAKDGSVTAANASGLNDGAAATLLMSADEAEKRGIEPLARIASYATAGLDPSIMGVGPVFASRKALEKAGWSVDDWIGRSQRSFAAQARREEDMG